MRLGSHFRRFSQSLVTVAGLLQLLITPFREAWLDVAKSNFNDLNIAMMDDLIDRQSYTLVKITYSEKVEEQNVKIKYCHGSKFLLSYATNQM